jgi:transposase-like protein
MEEYEMTIRRRFTSDFKAKVALEALRGDKTIQEIAGRHKVHPNQVSSWKRQAMDGLGAVFSNGADKARMEHEDEVHDLHAKIGQLTVERDFLAKGLKR